MIPILISNTRNTEVDGTSMRIDGAYKNTSLNSDPSMVKMFANIIR